MHVYNTQNRQIIINLMKIIKNNNAQFITQTSENKNLQEEIYRIRLIVQKLKDQDLINLTQYLNNIKI
jgi:hypothetical protein